MEFWTYGQIREKVESDLYLEDRSIVQPDEMMGYAQEAVNDAEAEIHRLYEDYFLNTAPVTFVSGTADYALPSDIYANKIRRFLYENGAERYTIDRLRDWKKFEIDSERNYVPDTIAYQYFITNASAGTVRMHIVPTPTISGAYGKLWYIREASVIEDDDSVVDIPEFANFIMQYMKVRLYEKDQNANLQMAREQLEQQRMQMRATLAEMVPDADNRIEVDRSFYEEMN